MGLPLRGWAVTQGLYALGVAGLALWAVPWRTPWSNALVLVYAALHLASAVGLGLGRRWGWRLGVGSALAGLLAAALLGVGLVATWAYLRGIYDDFGAGASLAALLLAGVVLEVLGLVPALLLARLMRADLLQSHGIRSGLRGVLVALVALPVLALFPWPVVQLRPLPPVPEAGTHQAVAHLRAAVEGRDRPALGALEGVPLGEGPVVVSLWREGRQVLRVQGEGADLAQGVARAADAIPPHMERPGPVRIQVDRIAAVGPVWEPLLALSVAPGLDGLRRGEALLLPVDLLVAEAFGHAPVLESIPELRAGVDRSVAWDLGDQGPLERVRTETWVEWQGRALPVHRGLPPAPASGPESWQTSARLGGEFMLRQVLDDGRFAYTYDPFSNRHGKGYLLARHAGGVYGLALLYGHTGDPRYAEASRRTGAWLVDLLVPTGAGGLAVASQGRALTGDTALAAVALLTWQRVTGSEAFQAEAEGMLTFLATMEREDGEVHHLWTEAGGVQPARRHMFASEQTALAMVLGGAVLGDERWWSAGERLLDLLVEPRFGLVGRFVYGADAWTCIAAAEAHPRLDDPRYLDFCLGYARFLARLQYDGWAHPAFDGHYGLTSIVAPQAAATSSAAEAIASTARLARLHGVPAADVDRQATLALDALSREQIRPEGAWHMRDPAAAEGGVRRSIAEPEVRIDFTRHAVGAWLGGLAM